MPIYEIQVPVIATTHIRADSPEQAVEIFEKLDTSTGCELYAYDEGLDQNIEIKPSICDYSKITAEENPDELDDDFECANDTVKEEE